MSANLKYDQSRVRKYHYFLLLSLIHKNRQISRAQLAELTQMSNTSVGKIIKELIDDELVIEVGRTEGAVGRRATLLEINPKGGYIIGVDVDLNSIQIANVCLNGEVADKRCLEFDVKQEPAIVLDSVVEEILRMVSEMKPSTAEKIMAVGVSIPGLVSWPEGSTLMVPQFHWENIKVKAHLEEKLDYVVYVDNHVKTALLAESTFGCMTEFTDSVGMYIGSGVGGAVMVNGDILRGHRNTLGEIGHITLKPDGPLCDCGRLGCLQTFICSSELEKQAQKSIKEIFEAFNGGEQWAIKLVNRAKQYLGLTISNIICMYNPEAVMLTGPMVQEFPILVDGVKEITNEYVWGPLKDSFELKQSMLGENSGVIGAGALVLNEFLSHSNDEI